MEKGEIRLIYSISFYSKLVLYAETDEDIKLNYKYQMSGNKISVKTLDLNCDFAQIAAQLDSIVDDYF